MKEWIKLLIMAGSKAIGLYKSYERRIEKEALCMDKPCVETVDIMYDLIERKRRIINLAVLNRELKKGLTEDELKIIKTDGQCLEMRFLRNSILRRVDKAYLKAERIINNMGFDAVKLGREYPGYDRNIRRLFT